MEGRSLLIEESHSDWNSPIIPKADKAVCFCADFYKVNVVPKFDAYSMPHIDEVLDWLGVAHYYSTLNLTKGY